MIPKVLIVDDERDLETLIQAKFRKAIKNDEIKFYFALNGVEALQLLKANLDLSIIMTDIKMPVMDGLTLLKHLPELKRAYKAIVVSAYGDMSNIRVAMNRGASDFIMKPINFEDFAITLKKIIDEYAILASGALAETKLKEILVELDIAKAIQEGMLPSNFKPLVQYPLEIAGKMIPAKLVGGDFYDFFSIDEHRLALVIADVSGKSISACLYMVIAKYLFRAFTLENRNCEETVSLVNQFLSKDNSSNFFVTAFYAILDAKTGKLDYCNAGHPPPYIVKNNGTITKVDSKGGPVLGLDLVFTETLLPYKGTSLMLEEGDCLFLYTDGITEAWNSHQELFSESRLESFLKLGVGKPAKELLELVAEAVNSFSGMTLQSDDITMLALLYRKSKE